MTSFCFAILFQAQTQETCANLNLKFLFEITLSTTSTATTTTKEEKKRGYFKSEKINLEIITSLIRKQNKTKKIE